MNDIPFSEKDLRQIAEQKVNAKISVKAHIAVFLCVNVMLFIINILLSPAVLWSLIPMLGWFIGLAVHIVVYILYARGVFPIAKRAIIIVFTVYLCLIALLFTLNYLISSTINWAFYPAFFVGIGIIILILIYLMFFRSNLTKDGEIISKREKAVNKELQKMKKRSSHNLD